ncbi:hypothetical protein F5Y13DRAFT_201117 [Hypoxylon sp. FL1857]|nr:hypothetical protein F5Y13DRAFT_201117 [Hypoxylon sp. FL1857]
MSPLSKPPPPQHPHLFTCTFCWHLSRGPPHVCGEVVFRGEECVSLGWCFWHRACYGCLLCGSKAVVTGPTLAELFDGDDGSRDEDETGAGTGREIAQVPTCANCVVECEIDSANEQVVVQNALRRMDKVDGGMARKRWERKDGRISRRAVGEIKRVPAASKAVQSPSQHQLSIRGQRHTSHSSHLPTDGTLSVSADDSDGANCAVPLDSTIYISVLDPLGEPAFKPSPTKPIPRWMQWLPSQRRRSRWNGPRPHTILDEYFPPSSATPTNKPVSNLHTFCPTIPTQARPYPANSSPPPSYHPTSHCSEYGNLTESIVTALKGPSFVLDEPLKRPSSRLTHSTRHSPRTNTAIGESVTSSNPLEALPPRSRSPYAPRQPSPLGMRGEQRDSRERDSSRKPCLRRPSSPLADQVAAHLQRYIRRTPPAQSREFINLYRPMEPSTPSIAVPGRDHSKIVGDGRKIRNMLARERTPSPLGGRAVGGDGGPGQVVTDAGEVVDLRSVRKRSSLQSEIKKLLSGRGLGRGGE